MKNQNTQRQGRRSTLVAESNSSSKKYNNANSSSKNNTKTFEHSTTGLNLTPITNHDQPYYNSLGRNILNSETKKINDRISTEYEDESDLTLFSPAKLTDEQLKAYKEKI